MSARPSASRLRVPGRRVERARAASPSSTGRPRRLSLVATALLAATVLGLGLLVAPGVAAADPGDVGVEGPSHEGTSTPTGTKRAESVLWFNDGHWWGNLWEPVSKDFHIFRFDPATQAWIDTGVRTEPRNDTHHDVLWDGTTLYVASHKFVHDGLPAQPNYPSVLRRYSYDPATDTYTEIGSSQINNHRTETLTIDKDTTGRLWATWQQDDVIWLNVTDTDGATWGTPFPHPHSADPSSPSKVSVDDAPALIAFGPGRMGLMWSRQLGDSADGFYWSVHVDGASTTSWSAPQGIVTGERSGDDHINLKWLDSSSGRVYAAVKTSFTSSSEPLLQLLAMTGGTWSTHTIASVSECPNRVIVLIDEAQQRLRTFATYPKPSGTVNGGVCTSSGGAIYEKSTSLSTIDFSSEKTIRIMDADSYVHNVTSTKQNLNAVRTGGLSTANSGLLVLADVNATKRYWHYHEARGVDTTAPTVSEVSPADGATGSPVGTAVTATFSEEMDPATITGTTVTLADGTSTGVPATVGYDPATRTATLDPATDLAAGTTYTARVSSAVTDTAGNRLAADVVWTFTTAATATPETVTLTATADSWAASKSPGTNYGTSATLNVDASPVSLGYLKFDLTPYAGRTVTGATVTLRATTSGSKGRQNIKLVSDDTWTETGLTYSNRPAMGTALGILGPTARNTTYTVTLDAAALQNELGSLLSLGLDSTSSDGLDLGSRETSTPPTLVLTLTGTTTGTGGGGAGDTTAPTVNKVSPADGATGSPVGTAVTATFSEEMDPATITGTTVTLADGTSTGVPATVGYDPATRTATLDPATDLAAGTTYTARVSSAVTDTAGNRLAADVVWTFTTAAAATTPETVTLTATADSWAASKSPDTNYGTSATLNVDASPVSLGYLKFDLTPYAGRTITGATLQLRATTSGSTGRQNIKLVTDDTWTETGLTYTNRPAMGTALGILGPTARNTTYTVTLDAAALQNELGSLLSLGLDSTSSDGVDLGSRETSTPPTLVLTLAP